MKQYGGSALKRKIIH